MTASPRAYGYDPPVTERDPWVQGGVSSAHETIAALLTWGLPLPVPQETRDSLRAEHEAIWSAVGAPLARALRRGRLTWGAASCWQAAGREWTAEAIACGTIGGVSEELPPALPPGARLDEVTARALALMAGAR